MTISVTSSITTQGGNGVVNQFNFSFPALSASDLVVIYTNAAGAQTTLLPSQYLVTLNPLGTGQLWTVGGFVTYPLVGSPIASGTSITISRILEFTQETSLENQGDYSPEIIEQALDTLCAEIQQLAARGGQILGTWVSGYAYQYADIVVDGVNGNDTGNLYICAVPNTSGTWSTDLANGDWSLALNVQAIVQGLPTIGNNQVLGNVSGGTTTPVGISLSALIDSAISNVQGSILYRSGAAWVSLPPGTSGQVLQTGGASANPSWTSVSGTGTITGVTASNGLAGGGVSGNVTVGLSSVASNSFLANTTGGSAPPSATTLSAFFDSVLGNTQGSIIYRAGTTWQELTPGSSGQFLITAGAAANPGWGEILPNGTTATTQTSTDNSTKVATTSFVQTAVASGGLPAAFGIGSYVLAGDGLSHAAGTTATGSSLTVYGLSSSVSPISTPYTATGDTLSGTWRTMQTLTGGNNQPNVGLWQRIS